MVTVPPAGKELASKCTLSIEVGTWSWKTAPPEAVAQWLLWSLQRPEPPTQ